MTTKTVVAVWVVAVALCAALVTTAASGMSSPIRLLEDSTDHVSIVIDIEALHAACCQGVEHAAHSRQHRTLAHDGCVQPSVVANANQLSYGARALLRTANPARRNDLNRGLDAEQEVCVVGWPLLTLDLLLHVLAALLHVLLHQPYIERQYTFQLQLEVCC